MNAKRFGPQVALMLWLACVAACARVESGPSVTQTREVEPFTALELRGAAQIDILLGQAPSLVVEADEKALEALRTEVRSGRLVIDTNDHFSWMRNGDYKIRITAPSLEALQLNGAANASIHGYAGGKASLTLSGAGQLEASGTVDHLVAVVNGAGNLDLAQLAANEARVTVNGTGDVNVQASERLDAVVNGVGNVKYLGKPRDLNTAIHGVGSIEPR